jgi:hypothetical protein
MGLGSCTGDSLSLKCCATSDPQIALAAPEEANPDSIALRRPFAMQANFAIET